MYEDFYSKPEKHGLRIVAEWGDGCGYEWDIVVVFQKLDTGEYLVGADSGCSCYGPFEYFNGPEDLEPLNLDEFRNRVDEEFFHEVRRIVEPIGP